MSYWLKIVKMSENRIVKQVYIMLNKLDGVARKNWVSQIRFLLKGLAHAKIIIKSVILFRVLNMTI